MPHIACGAEVYADSGLSPAGVAWKMTRLIDERMSNGKCGLHLGANQCLVCCFIDGLLDCCDRLGSMERENLVASCKKLIAGWEKTADKKREKLILKKKILTEKWTKFTNVGKVFCAGIASIVIFIFLFIFFQSCFPELMEKSAGLWNFIILVVSAPVAFAIWHFRDENNRQQIENQRKDINLKEFQKLSEWVSGAHLPEIKTVDKTTQKEGLKDKGEIDGELQLIERTTEKTEEYSKKPHAEGFDTFGKREGAVALQISAVYNLLPFFRGDYGESFRRPAFNLLKSAWQAMQQDSLKKWETVNLPSKRKVIIEELRLKAESPMGVALTHVLLSLDQKNTQLNLRDFPEMLPNLCLAGMNFHLSGVDEKARNWSGLNLSGVDFRRAHLRKVQFEESQLDGADLQNADLLDANLQNANLLYANLQNATLRFANLQNATLRFAELQNANLSRANLQHADLLRANLQNANLSSAKLQHADLLGANLQNANLLGANLQNNATLRFAELQNANLSRANLQHADLSEAHLQHADLSGAHLQHTDLSRAKLQHADLSRANLQHADLWQANLQHTKLSSANLQNARLWAANLQHTNLSGAELQNADLRRCDLSWRQLEKLNDGGFTGSKITEKDFKDKIYPEWKAETDPEWEALTESERMTAMQKFHGETGVCIYDKSRNQIIP